MSPTLAKVATVSAVLALTLGTAPALAGDPRPAPATPQAQAAPAVRAPASAAVRATYERMDPLARSLFWTGEMEINPADPVAGPRAAQALREMGRYDQAAEAAAKTLVAQPANYDALLELGRAHIARGQAFYGIAALEQARALRPDDWRPLSLLGAAYQQVRRPEDARLAWNEGLRLSPDNPDILNNVAIGWLTAGDPAAAETLLRRAVAQPGASLQVRLNLAMAMGLQNKIAEAEQMLRRDLPPEQADRNIAWLRNRTGSAIPASATARTWTSLQGS
ncbi:tetratricopeptide repeat protein [uncultured Brevundimonas sp.]|uniref:tetratricopeptide repeat protein n=1 Tax=uncultured Brevundimonas sp. TaxID=213418 RepID=UPI0030EF872E|tara:strand:+ start:20755 stop:21588 length:834 start_codon:yes stop_codon:yes gene_type:complete